MKNKFLKKLVALTLAGCLALGDIPSAAFASEQEIMTESSETEVTSEQAAAEIAVPSTELTAEATTEPAAEPKTEPTTEAMSESTAEAMTEPAAEPETEHTTETVAEPATEEAAELSTSGVEDTPLIPENVQAVQKLIDALPAVDALNEENMAVAYEQTEDAYDAYLALNGEEQAQITGAEKFDALFGVFNEEVDVTATSETTITITTNSGTETKTVDVGTDFSKCWSAGLNLSSTTSYWRVEHADGTTATGSTSSMGVIRPNDAFTQIAVVAPNLLGSGNCLTVYGACDIDDLSGVRNDNSYYIQSGSLTVHHTVNGVATNFVLTAAKQKLSDFAGEGVQWYVNGSKVDMDATVPLKKTAYTTEPKAIHITAEHCTMTASPNPAAPGETVTLTITADAYYELTALIVNGGENVAADVVDGVYTFTMPAEEVTASVTFTLQEGYHIISILDVEHGKVTADKYVAKNGDTVTLTITPDEGYELTKLMVSNPWNMNVTAQVASGQYTFTVPDHDVTVTPTFEEKNYNINIDNLNIANGWVEAGSSKAKANETVTLYITPDNGYALATLTVTDAQGNTITTTKVETNKYTFTMPVGDVTVDATFAQPTFTVIKPGVSTNQYTVAAGTTFVNWPVQNWNYSKSYWKVTRADGSTQRAQNDELGEIQDGDIYELIAGYFLSTYSVLEVYGQCDVDELTFAKTCTGFEIFSGSLTVHHTVDGVEQDFVLTKNEYQLSAFANGAKWAVNGEAVDMNSKVPLKKTAYTTLPGTITIASGITGGKVEADKSTAKQGEDVTLTITADAYYELATLTLNGGENVAADVAEGKYTFTMPAGDVTVTATFTLQEGYHTITLNADPAGSAYIVDGKTVEKEGETVYVAAAEGYELSNTITVRDGNGQNVLTSMDNGQWVFTMPTSDVTVTLNPDRVYSVTVDTLTGGTAVPMQNAYKEGDEVEVFVQANSGYRLLSVTATAEDGTTITASQSPDNTHYYTFTMPESNVTIKAEFTRVYNITVGETTGGTVMASSAAAAYGDPVSITFSPSDGYRLKKLIVDGEDVTADVSLGGYLFFMPDHDVTVTAEFVRVYTVTIDESSTAYAALPAGADAQYEAGETVMLDITQVSGKVLPYMNARYAEGGFDRYAEYTYDAENSTVSFTMPSADVEIHISTLSGYYIALETVGGDENCEIELDCSISSFNGKYYGMPGVNVKTTKLVAPGYGWAWTATAAGGATVASGEGDIAFTMPKADVTITVTFHKLYDITVDDTTHGTVTADKDESIAGKQISLTITPDYGYELETLLVNGADVTANVAEGEYTFTMPENDVTVKATLKLIQGYHTISVAPTEGGTLTVITGNGTPVKAAKSGTSLYVIVSRDEGYLLDGDVTCTADGTATKLETNGSTYLFTMPDADATISAAFTKGYKVACDYVPGEISDFMLENVQMDSLSNIVAKAGDTLKVTVESNDGYRIKSVTAAQADGTPVTVYDFTMTNGYYAIVMPEADVTISVTTVKLYTVSIDEETQQWFAMQSSATYFAPGETVTLTADCSQVYSYVSLSKENGGEMNFTADQAAGTITFTMPEDNVTLEAGLNSDYYYVTIVTEGGDSSCKADLRTAQEQDALTGRPSVYALSIVTANVTCPETYTYKWEATLANGNRQGYGNATPINFNMTNSNVTLTVTFTRVYDVDISEALSAYVSIPDGKPTKYAEGDTVQLQVTEVSGKVITTLGVNAVFPELPDVAFNYNENSGILSFTMPGADVDVSGSVADAYYITLEGDIPEGCTAYLTANKDWRGRYYAANKQRVYVKGAHAGYQAIWKAVGKFNGATSGQFDAVFTMGSSDATITVTFTKLHNVTISEAEHGKVTMDRASQLVAGQGIIFTIEPDEGYRLKTLIVDGADCTQDVSWRSDYVYTMPDHDVTVTAEFVRVYTVTIDESIAAYFAFASEETEYLEDEEVHFTLTAPAGKVIDRITITKDHGDGGEVNALIGLNESLFSMPADDVTISGTVRDGYHIKLEEVNEECIFGEWEFTAGAFYNWRFDDCAEAGAEVSFAYKLDGFDAEWQVKTAAGVVQTGTGKQGTFTMPANDATLTVTLHRLYDITVGDATHGTVTADKNESIAGKQISLTITPDYGYELETLLVNGVDVAEGEYTFTMPEDDVTVTATFKLKEGYHTITLNVTPADSAYIVDGKYVVEKGTGVTIRAAEGYWLVSRNVTAPNGGNVDYGSSAYWVMFDMPDSDVIVTLTAKRFYNVSVAEVTGGTVKVWSDEVAVGDMAAVTVEPDEHYRLDNVTATDADGNELPVQEMTVHGDTLYCVTMPESDVTFTVVFKREYQVNIAAELAGYVTLKSEENGFVEGETVTLTVTPDEGCVVQSVTVTGEHGDVTVEGGENNTYQFAMPAEDVNVEVVFQRRYTVSIAGNGAAYCSTLDGQTQYPEDADVRVNINLPAGKVLYSLLIIDSTNQTLVPATLEDDALTFTMPAGNVGISVEVKDGYYVTINMEGAGENEGCSYMENGDIFNLMYGQWHGAEAGSEVTLVAFPGEGYGYTVNVTRADGGEVAHLPLTSGVDVRFTMPECDVTITITFFRVYKVQLSNEDALYFSVAGEKEQFAEGETVKLNMNIPAGKVLQHLMIFNGAAGEEVPFTEKDGTLTFTMPAADVQLVAMVVDGYYINVVTENAPDGWNLGRNPNVQEDWTKEKHFAAAAAEVALEAVCPYGYGCTMSVKSADGSDITYLPVYDGWDVCFTMPESDVTVTITFVQGYEVCIPEQEKAYFTILGEKIRFTAGETVQIRMDIPAGKVLEYLTIDTDDRTQEITFTDENGLLTFTMPNQDVTVNAHVVDGYYIFGVLEGTYDEGCDYRTNTAGSGYYNCDCAEPGEQVEMTIDCSYGYDYTVSVTRADGGELEYLTQLDGNRLCFTMPACNVTVTVEFKLIPPSYIITIPASVSLNDNAADALTVTAKDVNFLRGQSITVSAASENNGKLVSGDYSIDYTLDTNTLTFTEDAEKEIKLTLNDKIGKPAGTYTDTLNFSVSITSTPASE